MALRGNLEVKQGLFASGLFLLAAAIVVAYTPAAWAEEALALDAETSTSEGGSSCRTIGVGEFFTAAMSCDPGFLSAWIDTNETKASQAAGQSWTHSTTLWGSDSAIRGSILATGRSGGRVEFSYDCESSIDSHVQGARIGVEVPLSALADGVLCRRSDPIPTHLHVVEARLARAEGEAVAGALGCLRRAQIASFMGDMNEAQRAHVELSLRLGCRDGEEIIQALCQEEFDHVAAMIGSIINSDAGALCEEWIRRDPKVLEAKIDLAAKHESGLAEMLQATSFVAEAKWHALEPNRRCAIGFSLNGRGLARTVGASAEMLEARVEAEQARSTIDFLQLFEAVAEAEAACGCLHGVEGMEADYLEAVLRLEQNGVRLMAGLGMLPYSFLANPHVSPVQRILAGCVK
jgi:hypothetical protein